MDLETILENFDAIVELPNGIEQVRSHIPSLALKIFSELSNTKYFLNDKNNDLFKNETNKYFATFLREVVDFLNFQTISLGNISQNEWILELEDIEKIVQGLLRENEKKINLQITQEFYLTKMMFFMDDCVLI